MKNVKMRKMIDGTSALCMTSCESTRRLPRIVEFPGQNGISRDGDVTASREGDRLDPGGESFFEAHQKQIGSVAGIVIGTVIAFAALLL